MENQSQKKLTIIITVYNRAALCLRALQSVLALKNHTSDIEIIIVDDGSVDQPFSQLEPWLTESIHYFYKQNGGAASAKNFGAQKATGEYILFLDSDDQLTSNALDEFFLLAEEDNFDFFYSKQFEKVQGEKHQTEVTPFLPGDDIYDYVLKYPLNYPGKHAYIFERHGFIESGGFDEQTRWGDAVLFWRRYLKDKKVACLHQVNYFYDQTSDDGISRRRDAEYYQRVFNTLKRSYFALEPVLKAKQYHHNWLIALFFLCLKERDVSLACRIITEVVRDPVVFIRSCRYVISRRMNRG